MNQKDVRIIFDEGQQQQQQQQQQRPHLRSFLLLFIIVAIFKVTRFDQIS